MSEAFDKFKQQLSEKNSQRIDGFSYGLFSEMTQDERDRIAFDLDILIQTDDAAINALGYLKSEVAKKVLIMRADLETDVGKRYHLGIAMARQNISIPDPVELLMKVAEKYISDEKYAIMAARALGRAPLAKRSAKAVEMLILKITDPLCPINWRNILALDFLVARGLIADNTVVSDVISRLSTLARSGDLQGFLEAAEETKM